MDTILPQPLISICVPTFNRPFGLERTIKSLLNQTYKNIEIIISDNCSTDVTVTEVINKLKNETRIKYFRQEKNRGPFFNFNFILEKATGEYFMRLADDDWLEETYVQKCIEFLLNNSEYSSAYGVAKIYSLENEFVANDSKIDLIQSSEKERIKTYLENVAYNSCFYGLFHRSYLPYLYTKKRIGDDWAIVSSVAFLGKYKCVENTNCYISQGGVSQSIESLTKNLGTPLFGKVFFYFTASLNIVTDIIWKSKAYRKYNIFKRIQLAGNCFFVIYKRFNIKSEIKKGIVLYPKLFLIRLKSRLKKREIGLVL